MAGIIHGKMLFIIRFDNELIACADVGISDVAFEKFTSVPRVSIDQLELYFSNACILSSAHLTNRQRLLKYSCSRKEKTK